MSKPSQLLIDRILGTEQPVRGADWSDCDTTREYGIEQREMNAKLKFAIPLPLDTFADGVDTLAIDQACEDGAQQLVEDTLDASWSDYSATVNNVKTDEGATLRFEEGTLFLIFDVVADVTLTIDLMAVA